MSFILFFLFVIALIIILVFSAGFSILKFFLRGGKTNMGNQNKYEDRSSGTNGNGRDQYGRRPKKIFGKDEGEYVDFEEIE